MELDLAAALADARTEYEKMGAGDWYRYRFGPELGDLTTATQRACRRITALYDEDREAATDDQHKVPRRLTNDHSHQGT